MTARGIDKIILNFFIVLGTGFEPILERSKRPDLPLVYPSLVSRTGIEPVTHGASNRGSTGELP